MSALDQGWIQNKVSNPQHARADEALTLQWPDDLASTTNGIARKAGPRAKQESKGDYGAVHMHPVHRPKTSTFANTIDNLT